MMDFLMDEEGQGLVEYGLILALIAIIVIGVLGGLGSKVKGILSPEDADLGSSLPDSAGGT